MSEDIIGRIMQKAGIRLGALQTGFVNKEPRVHEKAGDVIWCYTSSHENCTGVVPCVTAGHLGRRRRAGCRECRRGRWRRRGAGGDGDGGAPGEMETAGCRGRWRRRGAGGDGDGPSRVQL
jgi:hypothetical protein